MKPPRVLIVTAFCDVDGKKYRCAKLDNETYVYIKGNVRVDERQPLPIDSDGMIDEPCDFLTLRATWEDLIEDSIDRGDHESVKKLRATWEKFERDALADRPPRRPHGME
jgi:hypothetical protein